ncbi:MAG: ribulokinase [candidate division KSB1 bacterium]|nr:ribulokinase [candidate division KSB1 bacterium]MDZ7334133.1 ribulokinase [candidate division KSB1 bacterium]MDZ7357381.1 ribulokinase [candidate division KSB1 bacterium]MDZ7375344.1 ribulokinase [candidate division KSB1 bacterium]MDZ7401371.1 ribulokinase [candidate division KSB1 bacterium]
MNTNEHYVIGIDFGTDSVRTLIVDAADGSEVATDVQYYPRWKQGKYCDPGRNQFRQHPLDHIECLEASVRNALARAPKGIAQKVRGLSIDTTGSTPAPVDRNGTPLALTPGFEENPNAMFILWKDHTAVKEAEEINRLAKSWGGEDFTKYSGGVYSSEWFWSKILHVLREDEQVRRAAFSWVEHCDWLPALLTGNTDPLQIKRSRTAAGHKAMWHASWGGLPSEQFLTKLDPLLAGLRDRLYRESFTGDVPVGKLTPEWAQRLGLSNNVIVGVGSFDAHFGAIGAEIQPHLLVKVMGTSTCDMMITELPRNGEHLVRGICGQVDGSIVPGYLGLEAGQSAFGDVYAWFKELLMWPLQNLSFDLPGAKHRALIQSIDEAIIPALSQAAEKLPISGNGILALDWLNGRRTPDANQALRGAITGLNLGSNAPQIFRALVEATAFGAKRIVDRFIEEGVEIRGVIAVGGIPKKSPFVMQVTANVLNMPIKVIASEQAVALGTAMAAATACGLYPDIPTAQRAMGSGFEREYQPNPDQAMQYQQLYQKYLKLCDWIEHEFTS